MIGINYLRWRKRSSSRSARVLARPKLHLDHTNISTSDLSINDLQFLSSHPAIDEEDYFLLHLIREDPIVKTIRLPSISSNCLNRGKIRAYVGEAMAQLQLLKRDVNRTGMPDLG